MCASELRAYTTVQTFTVTSLTKIDMCTYVQHAIKCSGCTLDAHHLHPPLLSLPSLHIKQRQIQAVYMSATSCQCQLRGCSTQCTTFPMCSVAERADSQIPNRPAHCTMYISVPKHWGEKISVGIFRSEASDNLSSKCQQRRLQTL